MELPSKTKVGRIVEEGRACVIVVNKWDAIEKTLTIYGKTSQRKATFYRLGGDNLCQCLNRSAGRKILELVKKAADAHKRRVSTAVINEVLEGHQPTNQSPRTSGKNFTSTQVGSQPPSIALFVNDAKRFNDNYRRYIEQPATTGLSRTQFVCFGG